MPFVQVLWDATAVTEVEVRTVRDVVVQAVGRALVEVDPSHVVTPAMIDVRVSQIGPLDIVRTPLFITILARREEGRGAGAQRVVGDVERAVRRAAGGHEVVVELILTDHTSSYDYTTHE